MANPVENSRTVKGSRSSRPIVTLACMLSSTISYERSRGDIQHAARMMKNTKFIEWISLIRREMGLNERKYHRHCEEVEGAYLESMIMTVIPSMLVDASSKNDESDSISVDEISDFEMVRVESPPPNRTLSSTLLGKIFGLRETEGRIK